MTEDYFKDVREGLFKALPGVRFVEIKQVTIRIPTIKGKRGVTGYTENEPPTVNTGIVEIALKHSIPFGVKNLTKDLGLALGTIVRSYVEPDTSIPLNFILGFRFANYALDAQNGLFIGWAYEEEPK